MTFASLSWKPMWRSCYSQFTVPRKPLWSSPSPSSPSNDKLPTRLAWFLARKFLHCLLSIHRIHKVGNDLISACALCWVQPSGSLTEDIVMIAPLIVLLVKLSLQKSREPMSNYLSMRASMHFDAELRVGTVRLINSQSNETGTIPLQQWLYF